MKNTNKQTGMSKTSDNMLRNAKFIIETETLYGCVLATNLKNAFAGHAQDVLDLESTTSEQPHSIRAFQRLDPSVVLKAAEAVGAAMNECANFNGDRYGTGIPIYRVISTTRPNSYVFARLGMYFCGILVVDNPSVDARAVTNAAKFAVRAAEQTQSDARGRESAIYDGAKVIRLYDETFFPARTWYYGRTESVIFNLCSDGFVYPETWFEKGKNLCSIDCIWEAFSSCCAHLYGRD